MKGEIELKKLIYALLLLAFLASCASHPGRVCGGPGGGRVVENTTIGKSTANKTIT